MFNSLQTTRNIIAAMHLFLIAIQITFQTRANPVYLGNQETWTRSASFAKDPSEGARHILHEAHPQVRLLTPPQNLEL